MLNNNHQYFIYIIANKKNGVLYIGVTNSIERRITEHKQGVTKGFSKRYNFDKLIYFEKHQYINDAIKREKNMKKWKREWKIKLIEKNNPNWKDLAKNWNNN